MPPQATADANIEAPHGSPQVFYQFDDRFPDKAIFIAESELRGFTWIGVAIRDLAADQP